MVTFLCKFTRINIRTDKIIEARFQINGKRNNNQFLSDFFSKKLTNKILRYGCFMKNFRLVFCNIKHEHACEFIDAAWRDKKKS